MLRTFTLLACLLLPAVARSQEIRALFLGDQGPHQPKLRFAELQPAMANRGIELVYTESLADLNPLNLNRYDALVVYANIDSIDDATTKAILNYVAEGNGFVPLHCASFCFRNQPELVALMGAQFSSHGTGIFQAEITEPDHPLMKGFTGYRTWDETYVHRLHNDDDRTVLQYRVDADGREPWTWIRTYKKGRVFYTASGHDHRTWTNAGFQNLVERAIRWATGNDPQKAGTYLHETPFLTPTMTARRSDLIPFEYAEVGPKIPNYTPSRKWGTQGAPKTEMQLPLSTEESIKHFATPEGLSVRKYADERDFESKPIAMTWDERGRLWICETLDYPNEFGKQRDRIRICEDTDGDAVADKFTVFADGLSIPTAIAIVRGGALVQNGTETIFLKDNDGDDVADEKTPLITGWALGDTHGGVSNFRYGLDNWIWAMQGYNNSQPEFQGTQSQSFRQGFWRFKLSKSDPPQVTDLEFIRSSDNNTWGLGISEEGLIFGSTANGNPSMFMPIPNRYYERVRGWAPTTLHSIADTPEFDPSTENVRQVDHHGRYTAGAGHALYTARAFPKQWWNRTAFVCGPTGHLVGTFVLSPDGANYSSYSPTNLLESDDEWSAPIMAEVGPDGAVWVIDWYNYIVQHNPTPNGFKTGKGAAYESDLRDKRKGRIYRIVPDDSERLHAFQSLADAPESDLIQTLRHPSMRWRLQAQRLLVERIGNTSDLSTESLGSLLMMARDKEVDSLGLNVPAIHALHTLDGIGFFDAAGSAIVNSFRPALQHASAGVRRNAIMVLPHNDFGNSLLLQQQELFRDPNPQVRLQAFLALADMPTNDFSGQVIYAAAQIESAPIMLDALTSAAATHSVAFLEAAASSTASTAETTRPSPQIVQIASRVAEHLARSNPDADSIMRIIQLVANFDSQLAEVVLDRMSVGLPRDFSLPNDSALNAALVDAFQSSAPPVQIKLLRMAGRLGTNALDTEATAILDELYARLSDAEASIENRLSAARDLIGFRGSSAEPISAILSSITPQTNPEDATKLLESIGGSSAERGGELLLGTLPRFSPSVKSTALKMILSRPTWVRSLLSASENRQFDLDELSLAQKQALRELPDSDLRTRAESLLAQGGGLPDANREKVLQSLLHLAETTGSVDAGRLAFKKACANCHQHGDLGQKVGPNLTGMAVHPKEELLTHILDPSRNVEGNFRMYKVLTLDGQVVNGMLAGESKTSITIVDSEARRLDLQREDIDLLVASRKSVMPEGFEKQLSEQELTDLLEFLTDAGPYVPIPLDDLATAVSTKGLFHDGDSGPDRMIFPNWDPKVFQGIPFVLTNPDGKSKKNIVLLNGPYGSLPPKMPKAVGFDVGRPLAAIHLLSGVGGWSHPYNSDQTVSMVVRIEYQDGSIETQELKNAIHFADYIRRVDVPGSEFAFALGDQQIRYLRVKPKHSAAVKHIDLVKGDDNSAPIVMAITVEVAGRHP